MNSFLTGVGLFLLAAGGAGAQDKDFHIYLCLGQSNMEGFPGLPEEDKSGVDPRFQVLAAVDFPALGRVKGEWYPAVPPLCRPNSGLSPADYFGRTLVARLPPQIKVGVINVSVGGCKIELYDKHNYPSYVATAPAWMKGPIAAYGGNPYARLVELGRQARRVGVVKGILLHQGESNTGDATWPSKVKALYESLLADLDLRAADVPLIAGELLGADQNGACASMNAIIATLPQVIPTARVVSSAGCEGLPDRLHFSPAGYRELGRRYAEAVLAAERETAEREGRSAEGQANPSGRSAFGEASADKKAPPTGESKRSAERGTQSAQGEAGEQSGRSTFAEASADKKAPPNGGGNQSGPKAPPTKVASTKAPPTRETVKMVVRADRATTELRPIWNYFGYDEALTTLTPEGRHLLREVNQLSDTDPIRIRVHHLHTSGDGTLALKWSSTNVYTEDAAGNPVYDWKLIDEIMDELTRPGLEPFVQASFMPQALSAEPEPYTPTLTKRGLPARDILTGGAYHPPKDHAKWQAFIETWVRHSVERYGQEKVSSWLWELWNEPESPYFKGTVEDYCRLYDHFAAAVKKVVPAAKVGAPHTTDPKWKRGDIFLEKFLEHCRSGRNAATGGVGAPLDFIAYHAKGLTRLDEQKRVEMDLRNHLATIDVYSGIIARFPKYAHLPVYLGESDPEGCAGCPSVLDPQRDYRRTSQFASYTAASFMRKQDLAAAHGGNLQGAVSWAFTFHDQPWFNGLRALTTNEVALPVFNAFKLFARLGRMRVEATSSGMRPSSEIIAESVRGQPDIGIVATRTDDGALRILVWNYHDVSGGFDEATPVRLRVEGLAGRQDPRAASITFVDEHHANAFTEWRRLAEPQDPSPEQIVRLHEAARLKPEPLAPATQGGDAAEFTFELLRHSVALVEIPLE